MMQKKGFDYGEHVEVFPNISDTASANECTGLMPRPPQNDDELKSYEELFSMEIPKEIPRRAPSRRDFKNGVYDGIPEDIRAGREEKPLG